VSRHAAPRGRRARAAGPPPPATPWPAVPGSATPPWPAVPPVAPPVAPVVARGWPGPAAAPGSAYGASRWVDPDAVVLVPASRRELGLAAVAAVVVGVVVTAGAALAGRAGVVAGVALAQAGLVPAWVSALRRPGRIGSLLVGAGAAAAADAVLVVKDRTSPAALLGVLGLAVPALVVHQLTRGVVRVRVTESLAGVATVVAAGVALATPVALARAVDGPRLVGAVALAAAAGLAAARLTDAAAPVPRITAGLPHGLLALLAAALAGAAAAAATAGGPLPAAAAAGVGALVAAVAALAAVGTGFALAAVPDRPPVLAAAYLSAVLPFALALPVGYLAVLSVAG
jgi:hypothetical protein